MSETAAQIESTGTGTDAGAAVGAGANVDVDAGNAAWEWDWSAADATDNNRHNNIIDGDDNNQRDVHVAGVDAALAAYAAPPLAKTLPSRFVGRGAAAFVQHDGGLAEVTSIPLWPASAALFAGSLAASLPSDGVVVALWRVVLC
jgi:hypothetical protein